MSFFNSEIVREELESINELQNDIFEELSSFPTLTTQQKNEHIEKNVIIVGKTTIDVYKSISF